MTNYDHFAETFSNSRKNHPWPELNFITADIKNHGYISVLDIGCGNGRFLDSGEWDIDNSKLQYLGIDSSKGMIEEARRLHPEYEFDVCDMLELTNYHLPIPHYEAIVFLASFHHLESREERLWVLQKTKSFLAPWGRVYMTNWNLRDQERYKNSHRWDADYDIKIGEYSRYYHGFTLEELEELFTQAGYSVIENRVWEGGRNIVSMLE
jgi:tRNA (uracil-5-)-methyltransferase TRM9